MDNIPDWVIFIFYLYLFIAAIIICNLLNRNAWREMDLHIRQKKTAKMILKESREGLILWIKGLTIPKIIIFLFFCGIAYLTARCDISESG